MYKPIESAGTFQKKAEITSHSIASDKILYTYANLDDTTRPYGNLFKSFNFPITTNELNTYNSRYSDTSLGYMTTSKIVVAEIAKGSYGELIDGKTFQITVPVIVNGVATGVTCYGTYAGYNNNTFINSDGALNRQLSESSLYGSEFGLTPSQSNDFNSNVTFLFTNNLGNDFKPQVTQGTSAVLVSSLTLNAGGVANSASNPLTLSTVTFSTGDIIRIIVEGNNIDFTPIKFKLGTTLLNINTESTFEITEPNITSQNIDIYDISNNPGAKNIKVSIFQTTTGNLTWSRYTSTNKFPRNPASTIGKRYALFDKSNTTGRYDRPVGILYQDKGIAVFTEALIVNNFNYTAGTSSGFNNIASGLTYSGDTNFAKIYFASNSSAVYESITTEFVQNIVCVAGINEFFGSTNSTYGLAYDENQTEKPVFITTIGLYNTNKELIGIGKLSEPIKKLPETYIPFNIKLII
jgi:hypothetical protein